MNDENVDAKWAGGARAYAIIDSTEMAEIASQSKWASCPMTQLGVIRLLTNPGFSADALPVDQAIAVLKRNIEQPLHEFWPDSLARRGH